ncbi:MAG: hypothetical protein EAZ20_09630 [Bacteroidetes bacterium]|nr:MAG: hypothetical protein EAZ20_09630 [Bacteroidota bacterium]
MDLQTIFDILIHKEAFEGANFDSISKSLMLIETHSENNNTQLLSVTIEGIDEVYIAIKLDADRRDFLRHDGLIRSCEGEENEKKHHAHKKCDYLVFCKVKTKNYALLVEMKSNEAKYIPEKMKSTKAILAYFIELINLYYDYDELKDFKQICILFDTNINKRITEVERGNIIYKHQGFGKQQNGRTQIKHLIHQK